MTVAPHLGTYPVPANHASVGPRQSAYTGKQRLHAAEPNVLGRCRGTPRHPTAGALNASIDRSPAEPSTARRHELLVDERPLPAHFRSRGRVHQQQVTIPREEHQTGRRDFHHIHHVRHRVRFPSRPRMPCQQLAELGHHRSMRQPPYRTIPHLLGRVGAGLGATTGRSAPIASPAVAAGFRGCTDASANSLDRDDSLRQNEFGDRRPLLRRHRGAADGRARCNAHRRPKLSRRHVSKLVFTCELEESPWAKLLATSGGCVRSFDIVGS